MRSRFLGPWLWWALLGACSDSAEPSVDAGQDAAPSADQDAGAVEDAASADDVTEDNTPDTGECWWCVDGTGADVPKLTTDIAGGKGKGNDKPATTATTIWAGKVFMDTNKAEFTYTTTDATGQKVSC